MMRAFIAIPLTEETRNFLEAIIQKLKKIPLDAKWVEVNNLHITLKFLGEVHAEKIVKVKDVLRHIEKLFVEFKIALRDFGFFPTENTPRIFFVSTDREDILGKMADKLEDDLAKLGFKKEGRFHSHITLARLKSRRNVEVLKREIRKINLSHYFLVQAVTLYKSTLTERGPIYEEIFRIHLKS